MLPPEDEKIQQDVSSIAVAEDVSHERVVRALLPEEEWSEGHCDEVRLEGVLACLVVEKLFKEVEEESEN